MDKLSGEKTMMPDQCSFCRGTLRMGTTEFMVRMGSEIIVIKDVPAFVCDQCNESYFTPESSRKIDRIIEEAKKGPICGTPLAAIEVSIQE
ncbi:MAG TPA: type II toxin-antitoxin system MqsA family antitoxin [Methanospirillum sp.]|nr:type II toxin-antitoxin system MqsA family antitoxin [Methanospirillum sp.]